MITLGIDLSSQPENTAACLIEWSDDGCAVVHDAALHCDDDNLDALIRQADAIGIDAPLGWPETFVQAVSQWTATTWVGQNDFQKTLRLRLTDRFVQDRCKLSPLSVSTDRIALPAMRAMALLTRHGVTDRSGGDGRFFEVYPAGSLKQWGLDHQKYKKAENLPKRLDLLKKLRTALPSLRVSAVYADTDHAFDALIASLTTRSAAQGQTQRPPASQLATARLEGWIHLPDSWPN